MQTYQAVKMLAVGNPIEHCGFDLLSAYWANLMQSGIHDVWS